MDTRDGRIGAYCNSMGELRRFFGGGVGVSVDSGRSGWCFGGGGGGGGDDDAGKVAGRSEEVDVGRLSEAAAEAAFLGCAGEGIDFLVGEEEAADLVRPEGVPDALYFEAFLGGLWGNCSCGCRLGGC